MIFLFPIFSLMLLGTAIYLSVASLGKIHKIKFWFSVFWAVWTSLLLFIFLVLGVKDLFPGVISFFSNAEPYCTLTLKEGARCGDIISTALLFSSVGLLLFFALIAHFFSGKMEQIVFAFSFYPLILISYAKALLIIRRYIKNSITKVMALKLIVPTAGFEPSYQKALSDGFEHMDLGLSRKTFGLYHSNGGAYEIKDHELLWVVNHSDFVGSISLRYDDSDVINFQAGHIGYSIANEFRGKGYATAALGLAIERFKQKKSSDPIITCDPDNIASERVILKNNGILLEEEIPEEFKKVKRYKMSATSLEGSAG